MDVDSYITRFEGTAQLAIYALLPGLLWAIQFVFEKFTPFSLNAEGVISRSVVSPCLVRRICTNHEEFSVRGVEIWMPYLVRVTGISIRKCDDCLPDLYRDASWIAIGTNTNMAIFK